MSKNISYNIRLRVDGKDVVVTTKDISRMTRYDYITKAELPATEHVEKSLMKEVDVAVLKAAKKAGLE